MLRTGRGFRGGDQGLSQRRRAVGRVQCRGGGPAGGVQSTWDRIKRGAWKQPLSQDQLTRASAAIGVYKGLQLVFADDMALRWPRLVNSGPIFQRRSPVEAMIEGGIPLMLETRRYVDAVRGRR